MKLLVFNIKWLETFKNMIKVYQFSRRYLMACCSYIPTNAYLQLVYLLCCSKLYIKPKKNIVKFSEIFQSKKISWNFTSLITRELYYTVYLQWRPIGSHDLSNGAIFNNFEWLLTQISRARNYLTLNISETEQDRDIGTTESSSRMRVMNHNWSATKQCLHPQSVAEVSRHSVLSGDRIRQCGTSSGSRQKNTDQCL